MEADRTPDGAPAARQVGRARRRHRHRDRQAPATTARHATPRSASAQRSGVVHGSRRDRQRARHGRPARRRSGRPAASTSATKTRLQYEWAAERITRDLGAIRLDRLDREDIARWLEEPRRRRLLRPAQHPDLPHGAARRARATPWRPATSAATRRHESACPGTSPSPTSNARSRRGPRTRCDGSSPRSAITAGRHRSASACCTGCAAASCSGCAGRAST